MKHEIVRYASDNWGIGERQVESYLARAREALSEINKSSVEEHTAVIHAGLSRLYRIALSKKHKDLYMAHQVLMSIAKIRGVGSINVVIKDDRKLTEALSDEELDKAWREAEE